MTGQVRRGKTPATTSSLYNLRDDGAERYIWAFPEGDHVVLVIPGLRNLILEATEARTIGEILIQTADAITKEHRNYT
ncbi:MAG: hypothetical protein JO115_21810 [Pseudonocardiales bacterium]|nr:hypothetical protein [Pseudonocardiales bacterium]